MIWSKMQLWNGVEAADSPEFLPSSDSILWTGRMDYPILPNLYYNVITGNPPIITKENPNFAQCIMKCNQSFSTVDNVYLTDYKDGCQTPAVITSSNVKRWANEDKMAWIEITNNQHPSWHYYCSWWFFLGR